MISLVLFHQFFDPSLHQLLWKIAKCCHINTICKFEPNLWHFGALSRLSTIWPILWSIIKSNQIKSFYFHITKITSTFMKNYTNFYEKLQNFVTLLFANLNPIYDILVHYLRWKHTQSHHYPKFTKNGPHIPLVDIYTRIPPIWNTTPHTPAEEFCLMNAALKFDTQCLWYLAFCRVSSILYVFHFTLDFRSWEADIVPHCWIKRLCNS